MQILENMLSKTGCYGNVKDGDHVIQVSKCCQKILGKFAKLGSDSFNRLEVKQLQSWRGPQKPPPPPGLNRVKDKNTCFREPQFGQIHSTRILRIHIFGLNTELWDSRCALETDSKAKVWLKFIIWLTAVVIVSQSIYLKHWTSFLFGWG